MGVNSTDIVANDYGKEYGKGKKNTDNIINANTAEITESSAFYRFVIRLCFMGFGVCAYVNPAGKYNVSNIVFGALIGLFFGYLFKKFISAFLGALNADIKIKHGKKAVSSSIEKGMIYILPFCAMSLFAVFFMNWTATAGFVSAGIMTAGGSASVEIGKIKGKQHLKNTVASSAVSWLFSTLWIFSLNFLAKVPMYAEGIVNLLKAFLGGMTV